MIKDTQAASSYTGLMLSKVPEVTIYFWLIKVLSTTVGETAADFLSTNLNLGEGKTALVMSVLLAVALVVQFRAPRYVAGIYWVTVVLVSIVGTLITDNLSDIYNVPLEVSTTVFSVALAVTFAVWYASERTLSIHSIVTRRREGFYWLAILFTFALGTAAGDMIAEKFNLGYWVALFLFAGVIALVVLARFGFKANAVACFWIAYILTRPLGASLGDLLSQPRDAGGIGVGTSATSGMFLVAILALVAYLTLSKTDVAAEPALVFGASSELVPGNWCPGTPRRVPGHRSPVPPGSNSRSCSHATVPAGATGWLRLHADPGAGETPARRFQGANH